jgi:hypothetical protein
MTPAEQLTNSLLGFQIDIWAIVKVVILFVLGFYIVFAALVVREVNLMTRTLKGVFNLPIRLIAILQLIFSILVFILALVTL